jgi:hypothetical protein
MTAYRTMVTAMRSCLDCKADDPDGPAVRVSPIGRGEKSLKKVDAVFREMEGEVHRSPLGYLRWNVTGQNPAQARARSARLRHCYSVAASFLGDSVRQT